MTKQEYEDKMAELQARYNNVHDYMSALSIEWEIVEVHRQYMNPKRDILPKELFEL